MSELFDAVLPGEDGDTRAVLARELKKRRIAVLTSTTVTRVETAPGGVRASLRDRDGAERTLEGDVLLVSVRPATRHRPHGVRDRPIIASCSCLQ